MKNRIKKFLIAGACCLSLIFILSIFVIKIGKVNNELEKFSHKVFDGFRKSQILIILNGENRVVQGRDTITIPGKASYIWTLTHTKEGGVNKNYYNPKIIEKEGKKYITADELPEDILIIDENTLATSREEFIYVDLNK